MNTTSALFMKMTTIRLTKDDVSPQLARVLVDWLGEGGELSGGLDKMLRGGG